MSDLKALSRRYIDSIYRKDLASVVEIFDDNITLRHWGHSAKGKKNVIFFLELILNSVITIPKNLLLDLYQDGNTVVAELTWEYGVGLPDFRETQIITYTNDRISNINAYHKTEPADLTVDYIKLCEEYFKAWTNKDLTKLEVMFDDEVRLRDWTLTASGKEETLKANKNIFDSVETCKALPLSIYRDEKTIACRLNIYINEDPEFEVLDLITFNDEGKIVEILAFKG